MIVLLQPFRMDLRQQPVQHMILEPFQVKEMIYICIQRRVIDLLMIKEQANLKLPFLLVLQPKLPEDGGLVATGCYNDIFKSHIGCQST